MFCGFLTNSRTDISNTCKKNIYTEKIKSLQRTPPIFRLIFQLLRNFVIFIG